jgi:uncharacterized protein (TIGR03000 family)
MYSLVLMAALGAGTASAPDCHGCCGCYGGCYGYSCCGCYGGSYGGCYGGYGGCYGYSCGGCWGGGYGCYGCYGGYGAAPVYVAPGGTMPPAGAETVPPPKKDGKEGIAPSKAKLIVEVPEDAKLFIDDQPMKTGSSRRVFSTPDLEKGQAYYYMVRVEVVRDGKTVEQTQRVIVRAGQEAKASFDLDAVATARADE